MIPIARIFTSLLLLLVSALAACADEKLGDGLSRAAVKGFLKNHCVRCHGTSKNKANLALHTLSAELAAGQDVERWELVLQMLESGAMPPENEPQPQADERKGITRWIRAGFKELEQRGGDDRSRSGVPTTQRLTNVEYQNTMRDLLGFELQLSERLPKDPTKPYRFNNTAELMRLGPEQIDLYLECARRAMASAIVDPEKPTTQTTRREWKPDAEPGKLATNQVGIWGGHGRYSAASGMSITKFPRTGEFRVRVKAAAVMPPGIEEVQLRLLMGQSLNVNSSTLQVGTVGTINLRNGPDAPEVFEFRGRIENFPIQKNVNKQGQPQPDSLTITPMNLYDDGTLNDENTFQKPRNTVMPRVVIEWLEFDAPLTDVWPPEHHTRILFDSPLRDSDPDAYIIAVLRRFMSRAYRRPATDNEVARFAKIYAAFLPELKTLEAALRETLALVLVSPQFLLHTTTDRTAQDDDDARSHRQYELASRLSYFLWSSMPDDELLKLASEERLSIRENGTVRGAEGDTENILAQQVQRLLANPRSRDFVRNFTTQWLSLEKIRTVPINRDLFPRFLYYVPLGERAGTEEPYRPTIRDYMFDETVTFIAELIRDNRSVMNIVDSDFACLNQPLAAHYGLSGVHGNELRRVPLKPEHHLGGLLTQGSVLIGNGTGSAPHPVYRAVWLREAILGQDVPPPPADVPALTDSAGASAEKALSIKELLVRHRQSESCNDCHSRLDPWGIPFEQYNAIGKFQPLVPKEGTRVSPFDKTKHQDLAGYAAYLDSINKIAMQADARLPLGPTVNGLDELKTYLLQHRKDDIAKNVVRRLLTYGLGRELSWRDRFLVEELLQQAQKNDYKLRDMIVAICLSKTFNEP